MATSTFEITGLRCQSCVSKTESALRSVPGISSARVTLNPPRARVESSELIPLKSLNTALKAAGDFRLAESTSSVDSGETQPESKESLYPLFLIIAYIAGTVAVTVYLSSHLSWHDGMRLFMAGFFLVFSFFKLLDLRGFADTYRSYDVVAKAWPVWGYIYPFVEPGLGLAYATGLQQTGTNVATVILMGVGAIGVFRSLVNKKAIRCACLGTVLNLPMTKVTLVEDVGMAIMAAVMLLLSQ